MFPLLFCNVVKHSRTQLRKNLVSIKIFDSQRAPLHISKRSQTLDQRAPVISQDQQNHPVPSLAAPHIPVLTEEVLELLTPRRDEVILDMTFGAGGHSRKILESAPGVRMVCLDRDPAAYEYAKKLQEQYPGRVFPLLGRFSELPRLLSRLEVRQNSFGGVLMDLGVSSMQFDTPERGFMLSKDGPLDMRMDNSRDPNQLTALDILTHIDEASLYKVLKYYGEEKHARTIARGLVESRYLFRKLQTTQELAELVMSLIGEKCGFDKLKRYSHPATKTFQALRILVNNELNELDYGLHLAHYYLQPKGPLAVISFHSLEDTVVKRHITGMDIDLTPDSIGSGLRRHRTALSVHSSSEMKDAMAKKWTPMNKHVILPSEEEVTKNPRARSAKLRGALKA